MASVDLANVSKWFGSVEAVRDVDLSIADGELVVFVGPSGCGKSTLLRMIAGLEDISRGELFIGGKAMNETAAANRGIAMVFQSYALYPHMNVAENMGFALKMIGVDRAEIERKVDEAAGTLQIRDLLERRPRELSGGQRQRVAIGRALVRDPDVFLFDEPLSNLDADLRAQMRVEIARLHERLGTTMIYVTHDQTEAMTLASRIVVLNKGRIEQEGRPLELYEEPCNRFVASFIGQPRMNFLPVRVEPSGREAGVYLRPDGPLVLDDASPWAREADAVSELGIRPNEIEISENGNVGGELALVEQLGSATILHVSIAGLDGLLTVERPGKLAARIGERVRLAIRPETVHMFDRSGKRLKAARG